MAIVRTAKGTATDKTGALTLTLNSVQLARRMLIVGISYDSGSGDPEITWGNHTLTLMHSVTGNGITTGLYAYRRRRDAKTRSVVATWTTTAPTAKAMFVSTFSNIGSIDFRSALSQAATGAPNAGSAQTSNVDIEVFIGVMGVEGSTNDTAGTPSNDYIAGQRAGTAGAPPVSNITVQEIYKIVSATESTQAAMTGATARDWSSVLCTFNRDTRERFNLIQYDWEYLEDIFDSADLPIKNGVMVYNILESRMEMYEVDLDAHGTLVATWIDDDTTDWVTGSPII